MARLTRRLGCGLLVLILIGAAYLFGRDYVRHHPQDVPWTELRLNQPVGLFTVRKLAALADEPQRCRTLLTEAGAGDAPVPARQSKPQCGYDDGMRLGNRGRSLDYRPAGLVTSCPVAAALLLFEREVVQRAAVRHFNSPIASVEHAGSYSCRRLYGRSNGPFSEHATADAVDITGFVLANGTRISVLSDWPGSGPKAEFLREVRDGGCDIFSTVLSPDYNEAHADHLHLDMAERGKISWSLCR